MKHLKIAGLCLVAMFAVSMTMAASASAAWEQCGEGPEGQPPTKYTNHQCLAAATNNDGIWEWKEVSSTEEYRIKGSLKLTDTKVPIVGKVSIECSGESLGAAGPGNHARIDEIKTSAAQCRNIENCEEVKNAEARNLPWQTELYDTEGKHLQKLVGAGSGEPGWNIECKVLGISKSDECLQEAGKPESFESTNKATKNGEAVELLVLVTFQHLRKAKCSTGGAESGEVTGSLAYLKKNGWGLRVS